MRRPTETGPDAGFTLLETIIAMAILAIVLVSALRVVTEGGWRVDSTAHRLALARIAERLLTRADLDLALGDGPLTGTEGGASWRLERSPYALPEPDQPDRRDGLGDLPELGRSGGLGDVSEPGRSSGGLSDPSGSGRSGGLGEPSGQGRSGGLGDLPLDHDAAGSDSAAGSGHATAGPDEPGRPERPGSSTAEALQGLEKRPKQRLWLVKATVADRSGEQVEISTLRLEPAS